MLYAKLLDEAEYVTPLKSHFCHKEMGLTREEFVRILPHIAPGEVQVLKDHQEITRFDILNGVQRVQIRFKTLPNRIVGSLSIPRASVDVRLQGYTDVQARKYFTSFDRAFLRLGGG